MEISVTFGDGHGARRASRLAIGGAMSIYAAAAAKEELLQALAGAPGDLEVDLSQVIELDTSGVQLLLLLQREAAAAGKRVALSGRSPAVLEVLDCYGLAARFADVAAPHAEPDSLRSHERKR